MRLYAPFADDEQGSGDEVDLGADGHSQRVPAMARGENQVEIDTFDFFLQNIRFDT